MALTKTTSGDAINQMMAVDGTQAVLDAIHNLAFTMSGGVTRWGNYWPGDGGSNFYPMLGAYAPVIAQAVNNVLSDEDASFEGNTVGGWGSELNCALAASTAQAYHDTHSLRMTTAAAGAGRATLAVTGTASTTYTASCRFKGNVGSNYYMIATDTGGANVNGTTVVGDGTWQTCTVTVTWSAGVTTKSIYIRDNTGGVNAVTYWDAIQLEAGTQTPFAFGSRVDCIMSIPTASIGLTPGQDATVLAIVNGPWVGNDGIMHFLLDASTGAEYFRLYKGDDNKLYFSVGNKNAVTAALDATTWSANANHVVIGTVTGGTINVYLAGTAGTEATGATRETSLNANTYIGTRENATFHVNGAILCALWGRVLTSDEIAGFTL